MQPSIAPITTIPSETREVQGKDCTYRIFNEFPGQDLIVQLASKAFDGGTGLQIISEAELPFIRRFSPKEFSLLQEHTDAPIDKSGIDWGITKLKELQQFLGPIDDLLVHKPERISEKWVLEKLRKLQSIFDTVGFSETLSLPTHCSPVEQSEYLKLRAMECLRSATIDFPPVAASQGDLVELGNSQRFEYASTYKQLLGANLKAVIAYGGSLTAKEDAEIKDFDNLIVVSDVLSACKVLRNNPIQHMGKEVHGQILAEDVAERYLLMTYAPSFRPEQIRIIFGEVDIPSVSDGVLTRMGAQLLATNVLSRRKSLLSRFIGNAEELQSLVRQDARSIALVEAHTVVPLATMGWLQQFIEDPSAARLPKREAATHALALAGQPELHPALSDVGAFLQLPLPELRRVLAETVVKTSAAVISLNLRSFGTFSIP